jgi:hypothetical protein
MQTHDGDHDHITLGVLAMIGFERWALAAGRRAYASDMPLVFGVGLLPLLQWIVVPAVTLALVRVRARPPGVVARRARTRRARRAHDD